MNYTLITGYYHPEPETDRFALTWVDNFLRYSRPKPVASVVVAVGDSWVNGPRELYHALPRLSVVDLPNNLGHVHSLLERQKPHTYCGWSMAFLAGCLLAYQNETDALFLEQDCLAFGPWVQRAYADMGDGDMVFGGKMKTAPHMPCAQALVLVRHSFIPVLVAAYLALGPDADRHNLPEHKFSTLAHKLGRRVRHLSFGCDRERPIPMDQEVFYVQKLTPEELVALRQKGLL